MNWDAIGASAELLGALATVATLAYLALQIRQNTKMGELATATARSEQRFQQSAFIAQTGELNRLFWSGLNSPEKLTPDEYRHFESIFSTYLFSFEAAFNFENDGALSPAEWEGQLSALNWLVTTPGFRRYWSTWGNQYPIDFFGFVDSLLRDSKPPSPMA